MRCQVDCAVLKSRTLLGGGAVVVAFATLITGFTEMYSDSRTEMRLIANGGRGMLGESSEKKVDFGDVVLAKLTDSRNTLVRCVSEETQLCSGHYQGWRSHIQNRPDEFDNTLGSVVLDAAFLRPLAATSSNIAWHAFSARMLHSR